MSERKTSTTIYMEKEQHVKLKAISEETGIPFAVLIRRAVDKILKEYQDEN